MENVLQSDLIPYLEEMLETYVLMKNQLDELDKKVKSQNKEIKDCMIQNNLSTYDDCKGYHATYSVQKREKLDEDGLTNFLLHSLSSELKTKIIKFKPVIDMDELEKAMYNQEIDQSIVSEMGKFTYIQEVPTLKVTKKKGK